MPKLYELKIKDEHERLKVIKEVTKDHHEGKLDPGKMVKNKKYKKCFFPMLENNNYYFQVLTLILKS